MIRQKVQFICDICSESIDVSDVQIAKDSSLVYPTYPSGWEHLQGKDICPNHVITIIIDTELLFQKK